MPRFKKSGQSRAYFSRLSILLLLLSCCHSCPVAYSLNNKIVTNTVLNPIGLDKYPMVLYVHKNILSDSQGIHANVEYAVDGTTNSFVMIGTRINPSRGRYLIMSRTTQDLVSTRIISEDTIGVLRVTMDGSETKYTLS